MARLFYDGDYDRYWTEDELRRDYEDRKRNGELEDYYDTFEYYLEACMSYNNGTLKEVPEGRNMIEEMIKDLLRNNEDNAPFCDSEYTEGYHDGYHDALVDLMNQLGIKNNEDIINQ